MAASAGTVTLNLDANSIKLIKELKKAQGQTQRSAKKMRLSMAKAFAGMSKAALGLGVALAGITKLSVGFADKLAKTSDKLGIGIEALQEYRFAAGRAGVEQNTLDMALQRFTRRAAEAAKGTGEAKAALKELGVELRDNNGNIRSTEDLFRDVADAMSSGLTPADRLRLAFKLFDSEGAALVNMLKDGSAGLDAYAKDARALGVVMKESLVRDGEAAAEKIEDLTKVMQVSIASAVVENADAIVTLTTSLIGFVAVIGRATQGWKDWLGTQGVVTADSLKAIRGYGNKLLKERLKIEDQLERLSGRSDFFVGAMGLNRGKLKARLDEIIKEQIALGDRAKELILKNQGGNPNIKPPPLEIIDPPAVQVEVDKVVQILAGLRKEIDAFGLNDDGKALINLIDEGATADQINQMMIAQAILSEMNEKQLDAKVAAEKRNLLAEEYKALIEATRTPSEQHFEQVARLNELYLAGLIPSIEEYDDVLDRLTSKYADTKETVNEMSEFGAQAARNLQSAFADFLFDPFDKGIKGMLQGFLKMLQRMIVEALAAQILASIFGGMAGSSNALVSSFGTTLAGARADGGPVSGGSAYLVGEKGPEVIVPRGSGTVISNSALGGSNVTVNIDARESDNPARLLALVPVIQAQVEQSIGLKQRRGYA